MNDYGSVKNLKGVGDKNLLPLNKLGIYSIGDLLSYYPRSYDIFGLPSDICEVREGGVYAIECMVPARVDSTRTKRYIIQSVYVSDGSDRIKLVWYNSPFIAKQVRIGQRYIFRGKIMRKGNELYMAQPAIYTKEQYIKKLKELQPVYPLTKGITNNLISKLVRQALFEVELSDDYLSARECSDLGLIRQRNALENIHFPVSKESCLEAHRRIAFDEFVGFMATVRTLKDGRRSQVNNYPVTDFSVCDELRSSLPYELTDAQNEVINDIFTDMSSPLAMSRMVQGDVGSGKTIVAVMALLATVRAGYQGSIMAPTDVLARQHFDSISKLLKPFGVRTVLLTGQLTAAMKNEAKRAIKNHDADIIIGTHALIQDSVEYDKLGLAVIDEQHRFGVKQREALTAKGLSPHILVMSATPIPRSLAIVLYGDLDISIISQMPKDRLPIKNCIVDTSYRPKAYNFILKEVAAGHQAYIICPMVEESEESEGEDVVSYTEDLQNLIGSDSVRIAYLHGRMKPAEKNDVMDRFARGEIQILVSTTVVEVGVNVPNATVMMVENAERFGLAQLHQLRGRVGRGQAQSYCIFVRGTDSEDSRNRLDILVKYNDGMKVAEEDLKLRGPGDFFGTRQSGEFEFKNADIYNDSDVLKLATDYVNGLTEEELECLARTQINNWTI